MPEPVPARRDDRRREPKVVDITTGGIAAVIGAIEKVGDPAGGVRPGDGRTRLPCETELRRRGYATDKRAGPERGSDQQRTRSSHGRHATSSDAPYRVGQRSVVTGVEPTPAEEEWQEYPRSPALKKVYAGADPRHDSE